MKKEFPVIKEIRGFGFMIGIAKGGFGGLGSLLTPILSLVLPVASAVGVLLPMLMVGDAFALYMYWREWDIDLVRSMLPAGIAGALTGTFLLSWLSPNLLRIILGVFVLLVVVYKFASDRIQTIRYQPGPWHAPMPCKSVSCFAAEDSRKEAPSLPSPLVA